MPTFTLEESDFKGYLPDDTVMPAEVTRVKMEDKPYQDDDGRPVKKVVFKFKMRPDPSSEWAEHAGGDQYGETSTNFVDHPGCKLRNWAQAILTPGADLPPGYQLDTDVLVGKPCRIVIGLREYTKKGETEKRQTNFVKDVLPPTGVSPQAAAAAPAAPAGGGYDPNEEPF